MSLKKIISAILICILALSNMWAQDDVQQDQGSIFDQNALTPAQVPTELIQEDPNRIRVPDLITRTVEDARRILIRNDLQLESIVRVPSDKPFDEVVGQEPAANTFLPAGGGVILSLSDGQAEQDVLIQVPGFVGMDLEVVIRTIEESALMVGIITYEQSPISSDIVIDQFPLRDELVEEGTRIDLTVTQNDGVNPPNIGIVPDVVGRSRSEAERVLSNAGYGFNTEIMITENGDYRVQQQRPEANTELALGNNVSIVVSEPYITTGNKLFKYIIPGLAILAILGMGLMIKKLTKRHKKPKMQHLNLVAKKDQGIQRLTRIQRSNDFSIKLQANIDLGHQKINEIQ